MGRVREYIAYLDTITEVQIEEGILSVVRGNGDVAVALQENQLDEGLDAYGKEIEPKYSATTVAYKKLNHDRFDVVTTHDTGKFHRLLFMEARAFPVYFGSSDDKTLSLVGKYGALFGLTPFSMDLFNRAIKTELQRYFKTLLAIQ